MTTQHQKSEHKLQFSSEGHAALQAAFKDNDELLKKIRALLFGFPVTDEERKTIAGTFANNPVLMREVQIKFFRELDPNAEIGVNPDFWIGTEQEIIGQTKETVEQIVQSKLLSLEMLKEAMTLLTTDHHRPVNIQLEYGASEITKDPLGAKLIARNLYIQAIETGLSYISILANKTEKELKDAMAKNSAR